MKKKLTGLALFLICALLFVPAAMADSACVNGTFNGSSPVYGTNITSCNINGALDFSNFSFTQTPNQSSPVVSVTPIPPDPPTVTGLGNSVGFNFTGSWSTGGFTPTQDVNIGFNVTGMGGNLIDDVALFFSTAATVSGNAHILYTETVTDTDPNSPDYGKTIVRQIVDPPKSQQDFNLLNAFGGPVSSIGIVKDLSFTCGSPSEGGFVVGTCTSNASASFSGFGNAYSYVPEPRGISLLLGLGLLAGLAFFKRRAAMQS
jgi:hypothetical protein